jgi:hypothetical protein
VLVVVSGPQQRVFGVVSFSSLASMRTSSARVRQCSASLRKDWLVMPGSVCESVIVVRLAGAGRLHQLYAANETGGIDGQRTGTARPFPLWRLPSDLYLPPIKSDLREW